MQIDTYKILAEGKTTTYCSPRHFLRTLVNISTEKNKWLSLSQLPMKTF